MVDGMPAFARYQAVDNPEIPPPMIRTAAGTLSSGYPLRGYPLRLEVPNHLDDSFHVLHRSFGQDTVSEIYDVTWAGPRTLKQLLHLAAEFRERGEQRRGIQITLHGGAVADLHPGLVDVHAPVYSDNVAAGRMELLEEACRAGTEMN